MSLVPVHGRVVCRNTFVRVGDFHHRRFTDNDRRRSRQCSTELFNCSNRAATCYFLVIAQYDVNRPLDIGSKEVGEVSNGNSAKAFMSQVPRPKSFPSACLNE